MFLRLLLLVLLAATVASFRPNFARVQSHARVLKSATFMTADIAPETEIPMATETEAPMAIRPEADAPMAITPEVQGDAAPATQTFAPVEANPALGGLDLGKVINYALMGYIGYLVADSVRLLVVGATTTPPPM
ncbi:hypothetical protein B484DRAFT_237496 [Ochromonadaceae sp. CCMP2298]|nr:hypothetical protein B484DRAFT_237496 [Ochromonadaceae sp. CCMP2298]